MVPATIQGVKRDSLTVTDNRTGASFEVGIEHGVVRATELTAGLGANGSGVVLYDPGFPHTASCRSSITHVDVELGELEHRGYRIEALCEQSSYLELAYLLIYGELPDAEQYAHWMHEISVRKFVHENVKSFMQGFRYDAHPMAVLAASVGALSSFYADAGDVHQEEARQLQVVRLLAKMPTLAAWAYRHGQGLPYVLPSDDLGYTENLLSMMFRMSELSYGGDPRRERALDVLLMVHADHEQSAATTAVRAVGSTSADPYAAIAAGVGALSSPMRGSADREVLRMLRRIERPDRVTSFLERVRSGEERLSGFGHVVYRSHDPRAEILRGQLSALYEDQAADPLVAVADELARQVSQDGELRSRRLFFPNVDLFTGLTYRAIGIPESMFGVMFALARTAGWIAQWREMLLDPEQGAVRPRQVYVGPRDRRYVPLAERR
jgi:citrate synthase